MAWKCTERLWKTADGAIVRDGDGRALTLFATPGMELPEKPKIEGKAVRSAEDKGVKPKEDK